MEQAKYESEDNEVLNGVYADCFRIGHSAYKFVFDFGQVVTNGEEATRFHTRVITGPNTAKVLIETVERSIKDYENQFGRIPQRDE